MASGVELATGYVSILPSMKGFGPAWRRARTSRPRALGLRRGASSVRRAGWHCGGCWCAVLATKALYGVGKTFDEVSDTIRGGTGATGKDLDRLVASAKRVGSEVPASFEDVGSTVADLNTRLGLTGPALRSCRSSSSRPAGSLVSVNVKDATGAFSVFNIKGKQASRALDDLFQVSQATGSA